MEEQYREMFDEVRASSRLREEVAHMTTRERKPSRRRLPKAAVAAAAVLVLLAGTALAAVGAPGTIRDWFAREWEETTGGTMGMEQLALIDRLTKPVGVSDTQNGTTVTVDSVTVGNSTVWMLVKVSGTYTREKEAHYHFDGMDLTLDPDPDAVKTPGGYSLDYPYVGVAEDGTLTMLVRFTIDLAGQSSLLDGTRQATLVLADLMYSDSLQMQGSWTLTFPLEPGEAGAVRTLEEIQVPAMDLGTRETRIISLRDVEISATDITYVRSRENQSWEPSRCAMVLKDGTVVEQSSGASRFRDEGYTQWSSVYYWQVPVDLTQVTAVRFGDTEIPLN